ncbi:MAG: CoA-binding protein [candidate division Zixibacteria bacterium]|nr:CoA-binding protein [candidate division Zixibacteria bacterium]
MDYSDYSAFLLKDKRYAVFGVSLKKKRMGNIILEHLEKSGYSGFGINPSAAGDANVYPDLESLPGKPESAVVAVSPQNARGAIDDCIKFGIKDIWMQLGSNDKDIDNYIKEKQLKAFSGRCLLLYLKSAGFPHSFHRGILKFFGRF